MNSGALYAVKNALRIPESVDNYDSELSMLIEACTADLKASGVSKPHANSAMFTQCCIFYCKSYFGMGGGNEERWQKCYELSRQTYALSTLEDGDEE